MKLGQGLWLTTIGDLLTLLLCFVLTTMFGAPARHQAKDEQKQALGIKNSQTLLSYEADGRQFASNLVTEKQHQLCVLRFSDFGVGLNVLSEEGVGKIRDLQTSGVNNFEVQICKSGLKNAESLYRKVSEVLKAESLNFVVGAEACRLTAESNERQTDKEVLMIKAL